MKFEVVSAFGLVTTPNRAENLQFSEECKL